MKRLLFVASVCLGLFAFSAGSVSGNHHAASGNYYGPASDTTKKPKDTSSPKPDTPYLVSLLALQGK
jgi:hypothetical protein